MDLAAAKTPLIAAALGALALGGALGGAAPWASTPSASSAAPPEAAKPIPVAAPAPSAPAPVAAANKPAAPAQGLVFGDEAIDALPPDAPDLLGAIPGKDKDGKPVPPAAPSPAVGGDPTRIVSIALERHLERGNAVAAAAGFARLGVKTGIVDALGESGETWSLVTIGPLASRREARDARLRLREVAGLGGDYVSWKKP